MHLKATEFHYNEVSRCINTDVFRVTFLRDIKMAHSSS